MWFDSHCHIQICEESEPTASILERARAAGVDQILTAATDVASSKRCVELAREPGVYAAVGVHPNSATTWDEDAAATVESLLGAPDVVAVGETGLDFYRDHAPQDVQRTAFSKHIDLAKRHARALIIHTRDSIEEALEMLADADPPERFVFHCWSGDRDQMRRALDLGAYVSFAGNVSFKNAEQLQQLAASVPGNRLLVETDSPFLTPEPHRGKQNEPRNVVFVGAAIARLRDVSSHLLAEQTSENARALFGIDT